MASAASALWPADRRKRRWFQFSLRTLLVVVILIGCGFGWVGAKVQKGRREKAAVDAIVKSGGRVIYDFQLDAKGSLVFDAAPPGPEWLKSLLGQDFFQSVDTVYFGGREIPDDALAPLAGLAQLKVLDLDHSELHDAGMVHLRGLIHLRELRLADTRVTDEGLEQLKGLTQLEVLDLARTHVTDEGLEQIAGLTQLKELYLAGTHVADAGLEHIAGLSNLRTLDLDDTDVTDKGLVHLKGLSHLGLLYLRGTAMSDNAIPYLAGLTQLINVQLHGTRFSSAGRDTLQQTLPHCLVIPSSGPMDQ